MNILILSCDTGGGHNSAAAAIAEAARKRGHTAITENFMSLSNGPVSRRVGWAYVWTVRHAPWLYHFLYWLGGQVQSERRKSPVYYANSRLAGYLEKYLKDNKIDAIVSPHLFPAEAITFLKAQGRLPQFTVAVSTDYTCTPLWVETGCDYYVIPHKSLTDDFIRGGVPHEKLLPFGVPVRSAFTVLNSHEKAREALGLPVSKKLFLIMSGSMGYGKVWKLSSALEKARPRGSGMVVICGKNEKLRKVLSKRFAHRPDVFIEGYTERISDYMDACDVVFTKPGGLTSTEAAAKRIPIVHTHPIPGCETINSHFFSRLGMSAEARSVKKQVELGITLAESGAMRQKMEQAQMKGINPHSSDEIIDFIEQKVGL